jgi:hypothetical protein
MMGRWRYRWRRLAQFSKKVFAHGLSYSMALDAKA